MNPSERVRQRVNAILAEHKGDRHWTQHALAERIEGRNQSWVSKICKGKDHGGINILLEDLDALAEGLQTTAVELVRDSERYEFVADLKPHEMSLLRQFRRLSDAARDAVLTIVASMKPSAPRRSDGLPERRPVIPHVRELAQEVHRAIDEEHEKPEPRTDDPGHPPTRPSARQGYRNRRR